MQSLLKNLIFAFSFAVLVWLGYIVFFRTTDEGAVSSSTGNAAVKSALFLARMQELQKIELDHKLFTSTAFQSLVNNHQDIPPEPYGRLNPFEPLKILQQLKK
jgi:hypothetical protein